MKQILRGAQSANEKWLEREVKRLERRISLKLLRASPRRYWLREVGAKERYSRLLRKIVRSFWRGSIDRGQFWDAMADAIRAGFDKAWEWGARAVGIEPGELTRDQVPLVQYLSFHAPHFVYVEDSRRLQGPAVLHGTHDHVPHAK